MTAPNSPAPAPGIPAELAGCCEVRAAGPKDAAGGVGARFVATPASTEEAAALLTAAASLGLAVVARGGGNRLDWAVPPAACDLIADTSQLNQVIEHAAGDLVVKVQAGVQLGDLATVLAAAGQRLALDTPGLAGPAGTAGGAIATNLAGPLRYRYGAPRDLLIGITVIRADGTIARAGGKVVKNVAGYDLGKLFAGSYGTLGLITEATFRLHPLPEATAWVSLGCRDPAAAAAAVRAIASSPVAPAAIELGWERASAAITVSALLEGDADGVRTKSARLAGLLADVSGRDPADGEIAIDQLQPPQPRPDGRELTLLRVGFWAGQLAAVLDAIRAAAGTAELDPAISGSAAAGVLEVAVQAAAAGSVAAFVTVLRARLDGLADGLPPRRASAVVLTAPSGVRDAVDLWGPMPSAGLMRSVKEQFDPGWRLAPGRLAGGI